MSKAKERREQLEDKSEIYWKEVKDEIQVRIGLS